MLSETYLSSSTTTSGYSQNPSRLSIMCKCQLQSKVALISEEVNRLSLKGSQCCDSTNRNYRTFRNHAESLDQTTPSTSEQKATPTPTLSSSNQNSAQVSCSPSVPSIYDGQDSSHYADRSSSASDFSYTELNLN